MKQINRTTLTVRDLKADRYDYKRESKLVLSEEHVSPEEAKDLTAAFITLAVTKGLQIDTSIEELEIPVDEEESYKLKYEQLQKDNSSHWSDRNKLQKEIDKLTAQNEALKAVCPESHVAAEETEQDEDDA